MLDHHQKTTLTVRKTKVEVEPLVTLEPFKNLCPSAGPTEILMTLAQDTYCVCIWLCFFKEQTTEMYLEL